MSATSKHLDAKKEKNSHRNISLFLEKILQIHATSTQCYRNIKIMHMRPEKKQERTPTCQLEFELQLLEPTIVLTV
jgi:hypothetical protein